MAIKHPNLKLACCGLLAAALLPACGGGSSSSGPAPNGDNVVKTYQQGVAAGTAATLARVKTQLDQLHASLTGPSGSAQGSGGFSSFARALEPRNRAALAEELQLLINRIETARSAAATADADSAEAAAAEAQRLADQALAALRLVVAADTAARAGGGAAVQTAAANALRQIATVDPMADDAQQTINAALTAALRAAEAQVEALERALAAAGGSDSDATLLEQLRTARASLATARTNLAAANAEVDRLADAQEALQGQSVVLAFGANVDPAAKYVSQPPGVNPTGATAALHQRKIHTDGTDGSPITVTAGATYDAASTDWSKRTDYARMGPGANNPDRLEIAPAAVPYASSSGMVIGASLSTAAFPARGTVFRHGGVRRLNNSDTPDLYTVYVLDEDGDITVDPSDNPIVLTQKSRLQIQGNPSDADVSTWSNLDAQLMTSFQYMSNGGLTMRFGGTGLIYGDLEYHPAKVCANGMNNAAYAECNDITTGDMQISFGAPSADPYGERAYFWNVAFPSERRDLKKTDDDDIDDADNGNPVTGFGTVHTATKPLLNRYQLLLSNWAGDPSAGSPRYLRYAAYGLFKAIDPEQQSYASRLQTFHYGRDAFTDADNQRPANFNTTSVTASFAGHTMAWLVNATDQILPNPIRMRGDVSLTACLGGGSNGSDCSGGDDFSAEGSRIKGAITNLEYAQSGPGGGWTQHFIPNAYHNGPASDLDTLRLELQASAISATGAYEGVVSAKRGSPLAAAPGYQDGRYEGSLYGPLTRLEAAGTWWINLKNNKDYNTPSVSTDSPPVVRSSTSSVAIIGSFGACDTSGSACSAEPAMTAPTSP